MKQKYLFSSSKNIQNSIYYTMLVAEKSLRSHLQRYFGFDKFKGDQERVIETVLEGKNTFVIMPTGGGKSLCYQLPAMLMEGTAVVVSPLIALMKNQVDAMRGFNSEDSIAHFLNSSLNKTEIAQVRDDIRKGKTKLLYVAPESLTKEENVEFLRSIKVSFFAIDEAHCISEWGHDFRPEYRRLRPIVDAIGRVPVMALTATATPKVQVDIQKNLDMMDAVVFKASFNRPNLYYEVRPKINAIKEIIKYVKQHMGKSGIVYCLSRKKVEEVAQTLQINGVKALPYHAGLEAPVRSSTQDKFLMEEIDVICATIAFGMGIDKPDVRFVIHHDIPKSLEGYYQETGRAGRDGREGRCVTFYSYKDIEKLEKFMTKKPVAEQEVGRQLLLDTMAFAESSICRRKILLHYFGEQYTQDKCNSCDNCVHPKKSFDAQEEMCLALEAVKAVKEKFDMENVVHVLIGKENQMLRTYHASKLEMFGAGNERDERFWTAVLRQTVFHGFLKKEVETYGLLKLTDKGKAFLKKPYEVKMIEDVDYSNTESDDDDDFMTGGGAVVDEEFFAQLKEMRKKIAKQKNVPPFVIFQDPSLEEMAIQYPITMDELQKITGVGPGKAAKYGRPFLDFIKTYVEENEIERPIDFVVKSVVNKSQLKVAIIKNIDRKVVLDDMAKAKGIALSELLSEIESIVASGTKVDLNYYINEMIDLERQREVYDYFRTAETDSVDSALKELGEGDYSLDDIRLMRIKFMSEMAN